MPVSIAAKKVLSLLPQYDKFPVYLDCGSGAQAQATLTTKGNSFVFELLDKVTLPRGANIDVIDASSGIHVMNFIFNFTERDVKIGDLITCDVRVSFGEDVPRTRLEPTLLKGDNGNPDILLVF